MGHGVLRRARHQRGPALPSGLLSPQRCLVQVAFRPVLPSKLIQQEAFQALTKEAEGKLVRGEALRGGHRGMGWGLLGEKRCSPLRLWAQAPVPGALGRLFCNVVVSSCFKRLKLSWQSPSSCLEGSTRQVDPRG